MGRAPRVRRQARLIIEDEVRQILEDNIANAIARVYGLDRAKVGEVVAQVVAERLPAREWPR